MRRLKVLQNLPKNAVYDEMSSPVGTLTIIATEVGLHAILWDNERDTLGCEKIIKTLVQCKSDKTIVEVKQQLVEYFQGVRKVFELSLVLAGTDFQIRVWKQLAKIPYGDSMTYGEQAEKVGNKNKARAVGLANGLNPISIVIPYHRVIGSNGDLVGFGGGLDKKSYLLRLEKNNLGC